MDGHSAIEEAAREANVQAYGDRYIRAKCPVCEFRTGKPDTKGALSFHGSTGYYMCWKCGYKGRLEGYEDDEIGETFLPKIEPVAEKVSVPPPEGFVHLDTGIVSRKYADYFRSRGIHEPRWESLQVGYVPQHVKTKWRGRIIIPILDRYGQWVSYVGRLIAKNGTFAKYLYPKGAPLNRVVYNPLALESADPVVVVEGVFDALSVGDSAVALLGKASGEQTKLLGRVQRPVVICLDGDAWEEGESLAWTLAMEGVQAGCVRLPPGVDPGTADPTRLHACIQNARLGGTTHY